MRKNLYIIGLLLATLLLSCSKQTWEPTVAEDFTLTVSMPEAVTKTVLGTKSDGEYPVLWGVGDYITVNGVKSRALTILEAGRTTAVFHFSQSIKTPYRVQYGTSVPASQLYTEGNIRGFYVPMQAVSYDASFALQHQACILRLPLSGSGVKVAGVSVSALDGTPLCEGGPVCLTMPAGGVSISSARTFCIVLQPTVLAKGLKLEIVSTTGDRMCLTSFVGETLVAGKVYEFPSTAFTANEMPITAISTYSQLKDFAALVASGEKYLEARLVSDITADGTWTPMGSFYGDFDGGGYTISGLQKAFINELCGCARNLTVDGDITITSKDDIMGDESIYWAGILTNRMYTGALVSNCVVKGTISYRQWGKAVRVGAICGYAVRGTVENSTSDADISVIGDGSASVEAGGLIGRAYSSSELLSVKNSSYNGLISLSGSLKSLYLGGIVGLFDPAVASTFADNHFSGQIISADNSVLIGDSCVGGLAGAVKISALDGCSSDGEILLRASSAGNVYAGGILGRAQSYSDGNSIALSSCSFKGNLMVDITTYSNIKANPITGLYSTAIHTETDCETGGSVVVR